MIRNQYSKRLKNMFLKFTTGLGIFELTKAPGVLAKNDTPKEVKCVKKTIKDN